MQNTIKEFLSLLPEHNRKACLRILADNHDRFYDAPGSQGKHRAWPGGYIGHLEETMRIAISLYNNSIHPLPFEITDAILVLFLHDLEKPFKYIEPKRTFRDDASKKNFIEKMMRDYDITLTPDQRNAFHYVHGEGDDYHPTKRIMGPLAAFVHCCDTMSARIWFDYPNH